MLGLAVGNFEIRVIPVEGSFDFLQVLIADVVQLEKTIFQKNYLEKMLFSK